MPEFPKQTLVTVFQNEIDVFGVVEEPVESEHVGVRHEHLQLYLLENLLLHLGLFDLGLVHHLYGVYHVCLLLLRNVHAAESATA